MVYHEPRAVDIGQIVAGERSLWAGPTLKKRHKKTRALAGPGLIL